MRAADLVATIGRDDRAEVTDEYDQESRRIAVRRRDGLADEPGIRTAHGEVGGFALRRRSAVLSLRTRIPLPGVYGRIDHFGWDGKRANLIVSALGTILSRSSIRGGGFTPSPAWSIRRLPSISREPIASRCQANRASCASMMRSPMLSSKAGFRRQCQHRQHALRSGRKAPLCGLRRRCARRAGGR